MYVRSWKHFDYLLLVVVVLLMGFGMAMIYSATYQTQGTDQLDPLLYRQLVSAGIGVLLFVGLALTDHHWLANFAGPFYVVAVALLAVVLVIGQTTHGAQRWIHLPLFDLQPSELAKLAVIMALAKFISGREDEMHDLRTVVLSLAIVGVPTLLTFIQPDLGTSLVFVAIWVGMAVVARIRLRYLAILGVAIGAMTPVLWQVALHGYMRDRLTIFMDPSKDPLGQGYNIIQAMIGVGSGGFWGRGFLSGTQSQLHFLRVQYADFIFSVLAEELGFVGALALIALFTVLLVRGMRVASSARNSFGRLFAAGVVTMIAFQAFVNIGMNISLLPATGIPLPFISYGGSSLICLLAGLGVVESIALHRKRFEL